jgi:ABC-type antimicrobial peptide transport system permease subunit
MLKNYLKIALRNLIKNKNHTLINVGGLTIGVVCALVIFLVIQFEYSFDTHHADGDRIYRVVHENNVYGNVGHDTGVPYPFSDAMRQDFPEVEALTIVDSNFGNEPVVSYQRESGDVRRFKAENAAFVHPDYFDLFTYRWGQGDAQSALERPNTAVITQSLARKLFENENPVGKVLTLQSGSKYDLEVTGVIQDPPRNTDLPFTLLASYDSATRSGAKRINDDWESTSSTVQCYLKLPESVSPEQINARMDTFLGKYRSEEAVKTIDYFLQPLGDLHFDTRFSNYSSRTVAREWLLALGLIGLFLLVTACINFVNLNTAIAVRRSREVGVRKALGGTRGQLAVHFLSETALIAMFSVLLAVGLTEMILSSLESVLGFALQLDLVANTGALLFLAGIFLFVTVAAGLYPAQYLSGFNPIEAIRNKISASYGEGLTLRRGLVVVQFAISQVLIICTIVISNQMEYFRTADMGFTKESVIEVPIPVREESQLELFKNQLEGQTSIRSISYSNTGTANGNVWGGNYKLKEDSVILEGNAQLKLTDARFLETYGLRLLAGENLVESDTVDRYLVNETFARETGYGGRYEDLVGKYVEMWGQVAPIVGVVNDFHTTALHEDLDPVIIATRPLYYLGGIRINMDQTQAALSHIESAYAAAFPDYVFEYTFLDDRIAEFYAQEQRTAQLMNFFTLIAILIGCLGLFGLISYMAATRTKEIGVRKVLGATVADILKMFYREFGLLVGLAFLLAAPIAWYLMSRWLADFAYRIELGPALFILAFGATALIVVLTVGFKSLQAASANPVESLRSE